MPRFLTVTHRFSTKLIIPSLTATLLQITAITNISKWLLGKLSEKIWAFAGVPEIGLKLFYLWDPVEKQVFEGSHFLKKMKKNPLLTANLC